MQPKKLFPAEVKLVFKAEQSNCSFCEAELRVLKTRERRIVTMMTGAVIVHETYSYCPKDGNIYRSEDLNRLVPFKGTFSYDVLVYVGKSLYLSSLSEQAIKKELKTRSITISESEIRYLGQKFITYLEICHQQVQMKLRLKLNQNGGYILHIDGTCEGDSPHLFTGMDGISGIILTSVKLSSENKEKIIPFLKEIQARYGNPLAVISDMGKGLLGAVEEVFPGVVCLICHFHFLRDIGKDLLDENYRVLRNHLKTSKIRVALKNKAKDFEQQLGVKLKELSDIKINPELTSIKTALLLIYWIFDTSSLAGYGFPFDLSHLLFYQRLVLGYLSAKRLNSEKGDKPFYQLMKLLARVIKDADFKRTTDLLEESEKIFNELRMALRIALKDGKQGLNDNGEEQDLKLISEKVSEFVEKYASSDNKRYQKMIKQIRKYKDKLFADPIPTVINNVKILIQPQRTNNIMEQFFRYLKRILRKKNGISSVKRSITAMMSGLALVKNLENKDYLDLLLDGALSLEERFSRIESQLFLREFSEMKSDIKKIPSSVKKLIQDDQMLEKLEKLCLATAN